MVVGKESNLKVLPIIRLFGNLKCGNDQNKLNSKFISKSKRSKELNKLLKNGVEKKLNVKINFKQPAKELPLSKPKLDKNQLILTEEKRNLYTWKMNFVKKSLKLVGNLQVKKKKS